MTDISRWERLEDYLFTHKQAGSDFSAAEYAQARGFDIEEASQDIQSYLAAQRARPWKNAKGEMVGGSKTLYVLSRKPGTRTRNTRWVVGVRTKNALMIGEGLSSDVRIKVRRAFVPDLQRLRELNPRAATQAERQIEGVMDGALRILDLAARGSYNSSADDDGEED